jgi:hypothetical protein
MTEQSVKGEIKTIAMREGSSGIFTGDLNGLYQGYRFGSTTPDEREYAIEAPNGTIALLLRQQIVTPLPPRFAEHPFANGQDPFDDPPAFLKKAFSSLGPPPGAPPGSGPPGPPGADAPGGRPPGAPPHGAPGGHPPQVGAEAPGMEGGQEIFKRVHYMESKLHVVPDKCTGIFAGSTGEMEIFAPNYRMAGYLVIDAEHGELRINFLEAGTRETLNAELWVDGENSTGIYAGASGELKFALEVTPPFFGRGPYEGTLRLQ